MKKVNKFAGAALLASIAAYNTQAAEISTNTAVMQAMDKITGQVSLIDVPVNQEIKFGTFSIVVRECKTRTPEETPENFAFVDVVDNADTPQQINIFKGWMISSSPALNPIAHPVYDVWLLKCINKQVKKQNQMTEEQLNNRDNIAMNRSQKIVDAYADNSEIDEKRIPGEPLNLIPSEVVEVQNDTTESENIKDNNQSETAGESSEKPSEITDKAFSVPAMPQAAPAPIENKVEGEPEALLVISEPVQVVTETTSSPTEEYETIGELPANISPQHSQAKNDNSQPNLSNTHSPQEESTVSESNTISILEQELSAQALQ